MKRQDIGKQSVLKGSKWLRGMGLMVLMTVLGVMIPALSLAQNGYDFSGFYYIANRDAGNYNATNAANNYYLCPSTNTYNRDMPFLTTYKTNQDNNSKWLVSFVRTENDIDYYTLYHLETQKYLTFNDQLVSGNADRVRVHLQSTMGADDRSLFYFTHAGGGFAQEDCYNIIPKGQNRSLNPAKNNYNFYEGVNQNSPGSFTDWQGITVYCGGLIGYYAANDTRGLWYLEPCVVAPTLTSDAVNQTVSIATTQSGVTIYYTLDGSTPNTSSNSFDYPGGTINIGPNRKTVKAIAYLGNVYSKMGVLSVDFRGVQQISSLSEIMNLDGKYQLIADIPNASGHTTIQGFTGDFDGGFHTISGLTQPLFATLDGGWKDDAVMTVRNVVLKDVNISGHAGNTGAIACEAKGNVRIYNCGILSGTVGGTGDTGGLVGLLQPYLYTAADPKYSSTFVVNCYSFADITAAGTFAAGIVGNNNYASTTQNYNTLQSELRTAVVNCMFYGDVLAGTNKYPVYGNQRLANDAANGLNNYDFFMNTASLDDDYPNVGNAPLNRYNCSWPVEERYLTRYEYYRSIFNSNRRLCTWWVTQKQYADQTDDDLDLIAKWVLDPSIASYPILKPWGKYPSVVNPDPTQVWDEHTQTWTNRDNALPYQGKKLGTLTVTVKAGSNNSNASDKTLTLPVIDMDTLHHDFGYAKVQLPYYNEQFGDPTSSNHNTRYGNNYTDKVVTGWKITSVTGGTSGTFVENWESGYNFADRYCTQKDLYSVSKRVFAQGGYYYVPEGVTAITIEAYWGKAVYLHNADHYMDRVNLGGNAFSPAGTMPSSFNGQPVYTTIQDAISHLDLEGNEEKTVYDQAIVLVGNLQYRNNGVDTHMGWTDGNESEAFSTHNRPYTFTSVDLDFDNEPDYCFAWQFSHGTTRLNLHPVRFDFLPVPTLGMAIRTGAELQTIGVFAPRGHFEITETAFMHTGQFEYDSRNDYRKKEAPLILNGGQFEQFVSSQQWTSGNGPLNRTRYIILGGHVWLKEFTPGKHGDLDAATRHCAVSVLGGEYDRLCLSGVFVTNAQTQVSADNPHCYTNGGKFGTIAGAGMEQIDGNVTFMIDHSLIGEFYGGGLNAAKPVTGSIDVTVNNSIVGKYCGGPFTGDMNEGTTVTTVANNTVFGVFYGAGNGGTNYNRNRVYNANASFNNITESTWRSAGGFNSFSPLSYVNANAGYQAEFEFELIDQSSSSDDNAIMRTYRHEAQFTATGVETVTSELTNCTVLRDFYGAGNLGKVTGNVTSTLNNTTVMGSAFGGGFSADVPSFPIHDKATVVFPFRDLARVNHPGSLDYVRDDGAIRYYKWIHNLPDGVSASTSNPDFQYNGIWYCYTQKEMDNLGSVGGNATLTIEGNSTIYKNVFGGGDESVVNGNTLVKVLDQTKVFGNVYGGGNMGVVGGNTKVIVNGQQP